MGDFLPANTHNYFEKEGVNFFEAVAV
jgi:hypothetical protein